MPRRKTRNPLVENVEPADIKATSKAKGVTKNAVYMTLNGDRADKRGIKNMLSRLVSAREQIVKDEELKDGLTKSQN